MTADQLTQVLEDFLADARNAVVIEDGAVVYDLVSARYSVQGGQSAVPGQTNSGKCVLHLWSDERNSVRRVLDAELKGGVLRLSVLKFGQSRPAKLEICRDRDRRTPSAKKSARSAYQAKLRRVLHREHPSWTLERITTDMDLERSFGPVYTRALIRRGQSAFAVLGVNAQEPQAAVDGALTFGILWLDYCRERQAGRCHVEGLKLFVPDGTAAIVRERMAHLNQNAAKWMLYALDESTEWLEELDATDRGNIETHLVHAPDQQSTRDRFSASIERITTLVPECDVAIVSSAEVSFRLRGLEFARATLGAVPGAFSFRNSEQITFGTGPNETELNEDTEPQFTELMRRLRQLRSPYAKVNPLWRMVPERWLESLVFRDVSALDDRLDSRFVYSQVPAFAAADRGMIDVLTCTRESRLVIVELKADEDIHLPLQGVDYWARVVWHHSRGEFHRFGYFNGLELAPASPLLLLVAPALRVHPTTDTLFRYIAREIPMQLIGIDERWREGVRVVFRKRPFRT
ncbi:MAG TPA: hypothetical protein VD837_17560 [Terriglobales bacterium]|nr:hypothetical protein [Terriglobales bacterium]